MHGQLSSNFAALSFERLHTQQASPTPPEKKQRCQLSTHPKKMGESLRAITTTDRNTSSDAFEISHAKIILFYYLFKLNLLYQIL